MVNSGTYKLGPSDGQLVVKIDPDGIGKGMAHALTLEVKDWSADVTVADDISQSTVSVTANLGSLDVIKSSGSMSDSHSSLGIKPYSAPLGVIKVKDNVTVEFEAKLPS